jgi:SAM-dependent methyltransferase
MRLPRALGSNIAQRGRAILAAARASGSGPIHDGEPGSAPEATDTTPTTSGGAHWWDLLPFTTHRIELTPGITTMDDGVDATVDLRTDAVVAACGGTLDGRTVVDLGCLEGAFAIELARRGASHVLGIEARAISVRRCELARRLLGIDHVTFLLGDVKDELAGRAPFDVVFAAGILYHVADPAALLVAMRRACSTVTLIDTHVADPDAATHGCSPIVERTFGEHTYRGRMFPEYDPATSDADREGLLWAAYSDSDAFWPLEDDLVAMIRHAGFARIERVDTVGAHEAGRWGVDPRQRVVYLAYV